jgi:hypothetical protein
MRSVPKFLTKSRTGGQEDKDNEYPLEDADAVREAEREVSGEDVNIIGMIRDLKVDVDSKKDAGDKEAGVEMEAPPSPKNSLHFKFASFSSFLHHTTYLD